VGSRLQIVAVEALRRDHADGVISEIGDAP
jgi:hypothetical protein